MASYKLILRADKSDSEGRLPIYLRIIINRKQRRLSTGIYVDEKDWDKQQQRIKQSVPEADVFNKQLDKYLLAAKAEISRLENDWEEEGFRIKDAIQKTAERFLEEEQYIYTKSEWEELFFKYRISNGNRDHQLNFEKLVDDIGIKEADMEFFKSMIRSAQENGSAGLTYFGKSGGIEACQVLIAEIERLKKD